MTCLNPELSEEIDDDELRPATDEINAMLLLLSATAQRCKRVLDNRLYRGTNIFKKKSGATQSGFGYVHSVPR